MLHLIFVISSLICQLSTHASSIPNVIQESVWYIDPDSIVENVSTMSGAYTEIEADLIIKAPDPLVLSRFYNSQDKPAPSFGGWRLNRECLLKPEDSDDKLHFNSESNSFELLLASQGRRFYTYHPHLDVYLMSREILPSENKVFYEYSKEGQVEYIKETNASESKILAWIKIQYGPDVKVMASDGKTVCYQFDPSSGMLISVTSPHKPTLKYEYKLQEGSLSLSKKTLPEGRFVEIAYTKDKVSSVKTPLAITQFSYGDGWTKVIRSGGCKKIYRFNSQEQLIAVEDYLNNRLYRAHKKSWSLGHLSSRSIEDGQGNIFYYKRWNYDRENLTSTEEYGDIEGNGLTPLLLNDQGELTNQEAHVTRYSYFSDPNIYGVFEGDEKGNGVKYWYKSGTNLLIKKMVVSDKIRERHFYSYNEDGVLTRLIVDDAEGIDIEDRTKMTQRLITDISFIPEYVEVIEEKYEIAKGKEALLKRIENQRDNEGNIVSQTVYDAHGSYCYSTFNKYASGLLACESDPLGNTTSYSYDANQNLIKVLKSNTGVVTEYSYDLHNRLISTLECDEQGVCFTSNIGYDAAGYKNREINHLGSQTLIENDSLGRPVEISSEGITYQYEYDIFDHLTCVIDPQGHRLRRAHNIRGEPCEVEYLDGSSESFRYDSAANLHQYSDRKGILHVFCYDYKGRQSRITSYEEGSDGFGDLFKQQASTYSAFHKTSHTDAQGIKTTYAYDKRGRLVRAQTGTQKTEFFYDALGRVNGVKKWQSPHTFTFEKREYDHLDRVVQEWVEDAKGSVLFKKQFVYNLSGQIAQVIGYPQNEASTLFEYEYDSFGRPVKIIDGRGEQTQIIYDGASRRITIDPTGCSKEEIFDTNNRLIKNTLTDSSGSTLNSIAIAYDAWGRKILEEVTEPMRNTTKWSFNEQGQLESINLSNRLAARFAYHSSGELAARYNPGSKNPITYSYDGKGRLRNVSHQEDFANLTYDRNENLIEIAHSSISIHRTFNTESKCLSETIKDPFGSYQIKITYDDAGNIDTLELPDGSSVVYAYQGPFVKEITRFSKTDEELYSHSIDTRDQMGHILEETLPERVGKRIERWDTAARKIETTTHFSSDKIIEAGINAQIMTKMTRIGKQEKTTVYAYDSSQRLTLEKGFLEHSYCYDALGNRLQKNGCAYTCNALNQLQEAEGIHYTYDASGNLLKKTIGEKTWDYHFSPLNQLTSIEAPDGTVTTFTYDLIGRCLSKRVDFYGKKPQILRFFYLGDTEIGALNEKGTIVQLKVPSNPNCPEDPCIAIEVDDLFYVPLYDLQENVIALVDPFERTILESYHYSTYGEEAIFDKKGQPLKGSSIGNPWRYRGKRTHKKEGLIYFGNRYYDPKIGRWISPDPLGTIDGPNPYAFLRGNPLKYIDDFGLTSTIAPNCGCIYHDHPGWHNAPPGCVCICGYTRINMDLTHYKRVIGSALGGASHAVIDFAVSSLQDLHTSAVYMGSSDLDIHLHERIEIIEAIETSQAEQRTALNHALMNLMSIDPSDAVYHTSRSITSKGLILGSLITSGYGAIRGAINFSKLTKMPIETSKLIKSIREADSLINRGVSLAGSKRFPMTYPPYQNMRNKSVVINGRRYTGHSLDRMQDRGLMPSVIENTLNTGYVSPANFPGGLEYYDVANKVKVIVGEQGQIITIFPGRR